MGSRRRRKGRRVRVLFVGEGSHDVGARAARGGAHATPGGVLFAIAQRISPVVAFEAQATTWTAAARGARGYADKVRLLDLRAQVDDIDLVVTLIDRDDDARKLQTIERAARQTQVPFVCAEAVRVIEAWTLGDPEAIARHTGNANAARHIAGSISGGVESLAGTDAKSLLRAVLGSHRDVTSSCVLIAQHADVGVLCANCPKGFRPFADKLAKATGVAPPARPRARKRTGR